MVPLEVAAVTYGGAAGAGGSGSRGGKHATAVDTGEVIVWRPHHILDAHLLRDGEGQAGGVSLSRSEIGDEDEGEAGGEEGEVSHVGFSGAWARRDGAAVEEPGGARRAPSARTPHPAAADPYLMQPPPDTHSRLLASLARKDEMGLHSTRARYSRGHAVPRFWYTHDPAAALLPPDVRARESIQSALDDAARYEHMTVDALKLLCKRRLLKVSGIKQDLIRKLLNPQVQDRVAPPPPPPHPRPPPDASAQCLEATSVSRSRATHPASDVSALTTRDDPSLDLVPSEVRRELNVARYENQLSRETSSVGEEEEEEDDDDDEALVARRERRERREREREREREEDEEDEGLVAEDHDTPWTVIGEKDMEKLVIQSLKSPSDKGGTAPVARRSSALPHAVIAESDFERVLGKRKAQQLHAQHKKNHGINHEAAATAAPPQPHASLRYYMNLAGRKVEGL